MSAVAVAEAFRIMVRSGVSFVLLLSKITELLFNLVMINPSYCLPSLWSITVSEVAMDKSV